MLTIKLGIRSILWWPYDVTQPEGTDIVLLITRKHGLQQLISEPNHLLPNSLSSTDLAFTD